MLKHIDTKISEVYWYVGKITYELSNNSYGKQIIVTLSESFTNEFRNNLISENIKNDGLNKSVFNWYITHYDKTSLKPYL